jgi:hypothetical protein
MYIYRRLNDRFYDEVVNTNALECTRVALQYVAEQGCCNKNDKIIMAKLKAVCDFPTYTLPEAAANILQLHMELIVLLWLFDDYVDDGEHSHEDANALINQMLQVIRKEVSLETLHPIASSLTEVLANISSHGSSEWDARFRENFEYYVVGLRDMAELRANNTSDIESYKNIRMMDSGIYPVLDVIELAYNTTLPKSIMEDERMKKIRFNINCHVAYTNDLYSYEKDCLMQGQKTCLPKLIMMMENIMFPEAVDQIIDMANGWKDEIESLEQGLLLDIDQSLRNDVERCLRGYKLFLQGHKLWTMSNKRYCSPTSPFKDMQEQWHHLSTRK